MQTRTKNPPVAVDFSEAIPRTRCTVRALTQPYTHARARGATPFRILARARRRRWRDSSDSDAGSASDEESNQVDSQMCLFSGAASIAASYVPTSARERGIPIATIAAAASLTRRATLPVNSALRERQTATQMELPSRPASRSFFYPVPYHIFVCSRQRGLVHFRFGFLLRPRARTRPADDLPVVRARRGASGGIFIEEIIPPRYYSEVRRYGYYGSYCELYGAAMWNVDAHARGRDT